MLKLIDSFPFGFFCFVTCGVCFPISYWLGLFELGPGVGLYNGLLMGAASSAFAMSYLRYRG